MEYRDLENKIGAHAGFFISGTNASISTNFPVFFTARHPMEVLWITESHTTAATSGSMKIVKLPSGTAPASGTPITLNDFNLDSTANTPITKEGYVGLASGTARTIKEGERLAATTSGALTNLAGIQVTVYLKYANLGSFQ